MFLGAFLPLAMVCGIVLVVAIAILAREVCMLKRSLSGASPLETQNLSDKEFSPGKLISAQRFDNQSLTAKLLLTNHEQPQRSKGFEQEEDEKWLAEISSNLDLAVAEDVEMLDTAKSLLQLADAKQRYSAKRPSEPTTKVYANQQKEFYKRFVERKLSDLISAREGLHHR